MKDEIREIRARLAGYPDHSFAKYLDLDYWMRVNERRARAIGLDRVRRRRVLDIGTGCGYFPLVCREMGHDVIATDSAHRRRVYREVTELLGVPVVDHDVKPFERLPDFGMFDVVTAFMVTFNGHAEAPWGPAEWRFFVADVRSRLRPGGAIVLELNREPPPADACYTPELRAAFVAMGAKITGHWPHLPTADGHRLVLKSTA